MLCMLGMGIGECADELLYRTKVLITHRFFFADERRADGKIKGMQLDGAAHGEFFAALARQD